MGTSRRDVGARISPAGAAPRTPLIALGSAVVIACGAASACGASPSTDPDVGALSDTLGVAVDAPSVETPDARLAVDDAARSDGGAVSLRPCVAGAGAGCFAVTPAETGLPATGLNATVDQFALRPTSGAPRGRLLLFFNGSGGSPRAAGAAGDASFYAVARDAGLHVLGVSYASDEAVGRLCAGADRDGCFVPTRLTILRGELQPGAATELAGITSDEGVYARVDAALATLAAGDPAGGWGDFRDASGASAEARIRWDRVMASGHSQGGGHAALLGREHALARVVMLASPCDGDGTAPATWLASPDGYATSPATSFFGLGAPGDAICPTYESAWVALGMPPAARRTDAVVCAADSAHGAPLACPENGAAWADMLR